MRSFEIKLARAKEHLEMLNAELRSFVESDFYEIVREYDADGSGYVERVKSVEAVPETISPIIGDVVQNLRNSLDHIVWEIAPPDITPARVDTAAAPVQIRPAKLSVRTEFPIAIEEDRFQRRGIRLLPDAAQALIERLQPYHGWHAEGGITRTRWAAEHPLWVLNELSNIDKHRAIHTVAATGGIVYLRGSTGPGGKVQARRGRPLKAGTDLMVVRFGSPPQVDVDYEYAFGVTLEEDPLWPMPELLPSPLYRLVEFVEREVSQPPQSLPLEAASNPASQRTSRLPPVKG